LLGWDWLENVSLLTVLSAAPTLSPAWIDAAILFKRLKLLWLSTNGAITVILVLLLAAHAFYRVIRQR